MTKLRTLSVLLGLLILAGSATAGTGVVSAPAADLAFYQEIANELRLSDHSQASLHAITQEILQHLPWLTPKQAEAVTHAGPLQANHPELQEQVAAIKADPSLTPTQQGYRILDVTLQAQAKDLGVTLQPVTLAGHTTPSSALLALAQSAHVTLTQDELTQAATLDGVAPNEALALAQVIDAFTAFNDATTQAVATHLATGEPANWADTLSARLTLIDAAQAFQNTLPSTPNPTAPHAAGETLYNVDLSGSNNYYTTNYALSIDVGGDDTYQNNAGGNWLGNCDVPTTASAFLDFEGSDTYAPVYNHGTPQAPIFYSDSCGKVGGANGGAGLVLDVGGYNYFGSGQDNGVDGGAIGAASLGFLGSINNDGSQFNAGSTGTIGGAATGGVGTAISDGTGSNTVYAGWYGTAGGVYQGGDGLFEDTNTTSWSTYSLGGEGSGGGVAGLGTGYASGSGFWYGSDYGVLGGSYQGGTGTWISSAGSAQAGSYGTIGGGYGPGSQGYAQGSGLNGYGASDWGTIGAGAEGGQGTIIDPFFQGWISGGSYGSVAGAYDTGSTGFGFFGLGGSFQAGNHGVIGSGDTDGVGVLLVGPDGGTAYSAGSFAAIGGAIQGGIGVLFDSGLAGAAHNAGQQGVIGGAESSGIALLFDAAGDDHYTASGFGANGAGHATGHGALIDVEGNDVYTCTASGCNGDATDPGSTGLVLDVEGHDNYNGAWDKTIPLKGAGLTGAQIDLAPA